MTTKFQRSTKTLKLDDGRTFRVNRVEGPRVKFSAFDPFDGEDEGHMHTHLQHHAVTGVKVRTFVASTGETSVTLEIGGDVSSDVTMWGITLADLAAAVEAAQS